MLFHEIRKFEKTRVFPFFVIFYFWTKEVKDEPQIEWKTKSADKELIYIKAMAMFAIAKQYSGIKGINVLQTVHHFYDSHSFTSLLTIFFHIERFISIDESVQNSVSHIRRIYYDVSWCK